MTAAGIYLIWALLVSLLFAASWGCSWKLDNAGFLDVTWALSFTPLVLVAWGLTWGWPVSEPALLLGALYLGWSLRLGLHVGRRVLEHHPEEDPRYGVLRQQFPRRIWTVLFGFYQLQAGLTLLLILPFWLVLTQGPAEWHPLHGLALLVWVVAWVGEAVADFQLTRFRADATNRGRTCRAGLWRFSRHPNYFFEWLVWVAFFLFALPSPWGWITVLGPLIMFLFLFRVTGIPATEAQAVRSRGEDYRLYQQTTSAFFPWPPRKQ